MKKDQWVIIVIIIIGSITWTIVWDRVIKKITGYTMLQRLASFIKKWEGGLSRDPNDSASRTPAPWSYRGKTGWHTNKGVTYATFKRYAPSLGYEVTPENFFSMPDPLWLGILKKGFMKSWPLHKIDHLPRIQAVIITWAWGSGNSGAESRLARFQREEMGIKDSNITKAEIVDNFKKRVNILNEKYWFHKLCDRRLQDFKKMRSWPVHGRGWTRRLNDFRKTFG